MSLDEKRDDARGEIGPCRGLTTNGVLIGIIDAAKLLVILLPMACCCPLL